MSFCHTSAAAPSAGPAADPPPADPVLRAIHDHPSIRPVLEHPDQYRPQLMISVVDESGPEPTIQTTIIARGSVAAEAPGTHNAADAHGTGDVYFYPASSIKLFAAVAALQRIQELNALGVPVTIDTPLAFYPMFDGEPLETTDDSNLAAGTITLGHEIRKLFVVSDNRAFNRLLGFVGRDDLNQMMHDAGLPSVRVSHRLSIGYTAEQNRRMPRIDLRLPSGTVHTITERTDSPVSPLEGVTGLRVGQAELVNGERQERARDFAFSNRVALEDLHRAVIMLTRPDIDQGIPGFTLTPEHRRFILDAMSALPRESQNPSYDPAQYGDDWVKFMLPGIRRVIQSDRVRVFNKIGLAYGFTSTTAAIAIDGAPPRVFVTGTIYTNANQTLNDNAYEYETVALPFWAGVGEAVAKTLLSESEKTNND